MKRVFPFLALLGCLSASAAWFFVGGVPAWTPANLTLVAWFQPFNYTTGGSWADSGPNSYTATLAGTGADPTFVAGAFSGQGVVRFTGGKIFQFASGVAISPESQPQIIAIVFKYNSAVGSGNYQGLLTTGTVVSPAASFTILALDFAGYTPFSFGGGKGIGGTGFGINSYDYYSAFQYVLVNYSGGGFDVTSNYTISKNGSSQTLAQNTGGTNSAACVGTIGDFFVGGGGPMQGDIGEIIIANSPSPTDLTNLNSYISAKWGGL